MGRARKANVIAALAGMIAVRRINRRALDRVIGLRSAISTSAAWSLSTVCVFSFAAIIAIVGILTVLLSGQFLDDEHLPSGEFLTLIMFATCGMLMMVLRVTW